MILHLHLVRLQSISLSYAYSLRRFIEMENSRDDDVAAAANVEEGPEAAFTIEVLFFGSARELVGNLSAITLGLPEGSDTASLR
jgi:hypothetical protein